MFPAVLFVAKDVGVETDTPVLLPTHVLEVLNDDVIPDAKDGALLHPVLELPKS